MGCAELISSGKIKIKSSASTDQLLEIQQITQAGLAFSDGTYLNADIILFASVYLSAEAEIHLTPVEPERDLKTLEELLKTYLDPMSLTQPQRSGV